MHLYQLFFSKNGVKDILKEMDNDTMSLLGSEFPLTVEKTQEIAKNLKGIMDQKHNAGLVSSDTLENFEMYGRFVIKENSRTL